VSPIHVTEAEGVVLEALWRCGPLPPVRLITEVKSVRPWGDATIKTLLGRLIHKRAVRSERNEGLLRYQALIERSAFQESEVRALIDRLFHGDPEELAAFLSNHFRQAEIVAGA
jgi:BlaI family penicillinase repressor